MTTTLIEQWFTDYKDYVYGYLVHFVGISEADDLLQETFISALRSVHTFKGNSNPKTWLCKIARNVAIDYLRKNKRRDTYRTPFTEDIFNAPSTALSPEESAELRELQATLTVCIQELKKNHRDVIILRAILGMSVAETAEILDWNQAKVRVTYHRALKALHQVYTERGIGGMSQWLET